MLWIHWFWFPSLRYFCFWWSSHFVSRSYSRRGSFGWEIVLCRFRCFRFYAFLACFLRELVPWKLLFVYFYTFCRHLCWRVSQGARFWWKLNHFCQLCFCCRIPSFMFLYCHLQFLPYYFFYMSSQIILWVLLAS